MNLWWLALIIPAGLFLGLFGIYFFNLDMKMVAKVYNFFVRYHEKKVKETAI